MVVADTIGAIGVAVRSVATAAAVLADAKGRQAVLVVEAEVTLAALFSGLGAFVVEALDQIRDSLAAGRNLEDGRRCRRRRRCCRRRCRGRADDVELEIIPAVFVPDPV